MSWRPSSIVICEDLRIEGNGKQILIGVYAGDIIFPSFPARINQLIFRVELLGNIEKRKTLLFKIRASDGSLLMDLTGDAPRSSPHENSVFIFGLHHPVFQKTEKYVVEIGFDNALAEIGEFRVRTPQSPSEIDKVISANTA